MEKTFKNADSATLVRCVIPISGMVRIVWNLPNGNFIGEIQATAVNLEALKAIAADLLVWANEQEVPQIQSAVRSALETN
jgi:hypothetical protein